MRARWKILGGAGLASVGIALAIVGHSGKVAGGTPAPDLTTSPDPATGAPPAPEDPHLTNPFTQYPLGPGAIAYDQLDTAGKAGVDQMKQTLETSQPDTSYQAFSNAADQAIADSQAQIAARAVGLVGVDQQGIVP
jgi:hypothetical protein